MTSANTRVLHEYPERLGGLAEIFRRRRVGVGVDSRGRLVLARPDTIEVDFTGGTTRRKRILELVGNLEGRNDDLDLTEARSTRVLTVRIAAELDDGNDRGGESRWRLDRLNDTVDRFRANEVGADVNHVVFGAHSSVTQMLGGALTGASAPSSAATTVMTPENRAVLITTAQPAIAPRVLRDRLDLEDRQRPRVLVIDTGLRTMSNGKDNVPEHTFLQSPSRSQPRVHLHTSWQSNSAVDAVDDEDETDDDGSGSLDFEAGHGTFITGVVRQICPDARICPAGVLSSFGEGSLARVRSTIRRMNRTCGPFDVVVMSFGTFCTDDDPGLLATWLPRLLGNAVGVAAAGNLQTSRPYFPAALPGVIGVGGLDGGGPAWFTNFGSWVDACAPAVNVVSTFFNDVTETLSGQSPRRFQQWARWSGTSFAAPKVAGAIAQEMYLSQVAPDEAWRRLSSPERLRIPDLGVVINV